MHLKIVFSPSGSKHVREIESIKWLSRRLHMVFECVGFGHEYSVSFKMSPSKQTWHLDKIAQLLPKKVCQNSIKQYSFYIKCNGFSAIIPIISIGPLA